MKKIYFLVAILALTACTNKESLTPENSKESTGIVFSASIEQSLDTKAILDRPDTKWSAGDKIRVWIRNNADTWQDVIDFTLIGAGGSTSGTFSNANNYADGNVWNWYSFFPYYYTGSSGETNTGSNMGGDNTFYFYLPADYYSYTSGQSFLPLLADMSGDEGHPSSINYKYGGAAIELPLYNIPGAAEKVMLTISGKNITGWCGGIVLSNLGTDKLVSSEGADDHVSLHIESSGSTDRGTEGTPFKFVFPIPTIVQDAQVPMTFSMYDKYGVKIWEKTGKNKAGTKIDRAKAVVMPKQAVAATPTEMYLRGWINGTDVEDNSIAFSNGTCKHTFTQDSYLYLYNNTIVKAYIPAAQETTNSYVECFKTDSWDKSSCPKLKIPAGTYDLSITYNSGGSMTLSYVVASE